MSHEPASPAAASALTAAAAHATPATAAVTASAPRTPRRGFFRRMAVAATAFAAGSAIPVALRAKPVLFDGGGAGESGGKSEGGAPDNPWDESWLKGLTGKHKQIFHWVHLNDGAALIHARNFLEAFREAYNADGGDVNVLIGVHNQSSTAMFNDQMWQEYAFGERVQLTDPTTKAHSLRNAFTHLKDGDSLPKEMSIEALQARGVVFLQCDRAMNALAGSLATKHGIKTDVVRADLKANLLPGVILVPALVVALNRAQAAGCSYVFSG